MKTSICAIADLHCQTNLRTPEADILVVAGDLTYRGTIQELQKVRRWLVSQPQPHKVVIAGNHDFCFQNDARHEAEHMMGGDGIIYLRDEAATVAGVKIYGSPWQPWFYDWAFNLPRGPALAEKWALIPDNLDLLVVHGPPHGYGDLTSEGERAGCEDLYRAIVKKTPKNVVYGHIHENVGRWQVGPSTLYNCSVGPNGLSYSGQPVLFEIETDK